MAALRQTFHELSGIDTQGYIESLPALGDELDARLAAIERMLDGQAPWHQPVAVVCKPDRAQLAGLSHLEQSAVLLAISHLTQLERETRALLGTMRYIRRFAPAHDAGRLADVPAARAPLDPDWLIGVRRVTAVLWLNLLLYFRSSAFLMATTGWPRDRAPSRLQQWRKAFHLNDVVSAPGKLAGWAPALSASALGSTS